MTELTEELLGVMRNAAGKTLAAGEQFVSARSLLLALLDDPEVGPRLRGAVARERLESLEPVEIDLTGVSRMPDERVPAGEEPALARYDTLAFKTPDGSASAWLDKDALYMFSEGANRAGQLQYYPRHLALGIASVAMKQPAVLSAMRIEPGALVDAIYKL